MPANFINPLEKIDQLLTCSVCLDRYRLPKLLPCQHTYCMEPCLDGLVDIVRRTVKCPECRADHPIPFDGARGFQTNITMMGFLEIHLRATDDNSADMEAYIRRFNMDRCKVCDEKAEVELCSHCDKSICIECKTTHIDMVKRDLGRLMNQIKRISTRLVETSDSLERGLASLTGNAETVKEEIQDYVRRFVKELKKREDTLLTEIDTFSQAETRMMRELFENLKIELDNINDACSKVDGSLKGDSELPDDQLCKYKLLFSDGLEYLRLFNPESEDLATKKIRFAVGPDPHILPHAIAQFGELHVCTTHFNKFQANDNFQYQPRFSIGLESDNYPMKRHGLDIESVLNANRSDDDSTRISAFSNRRSNLDTDYRSRRFNVDDTSRTTSTRTGTRGGTSVQTGQFGINSPFARTQQSSPEPIPRDPPPTDSSVMSSSAQEALNRHRSPRAESTEDEELNERIALIRQEYETRRKEMVRMDNAVAAVLDDTPPEPNTTKVTTKEKSDKIEVKCSKKHEERIQTPKTSSKSKVSDSETDGSINRDREMKQYRSRTKTMPESSTREMTPQPERDVNSGDESELSSVAIKVTHYRPSTSTTSSTRLNRNAHDLYPPEVRQHSIDWKRYLIPSPGAESQRALPTVQVESTLNQIPELNPAIPSYLTRIDRDQRSSSRDESDSSDWLDRRKRFVRSRTNPDFYSPEPETNTVAKAEYRRRIEKDDSSPPQSSREENRPSRYRKKGEKSSTSRSYTPGRENGQVESRTVKTTTTTTTATLPKIKYSEKGNFSNLLKFGQKGAAYGLFNWPRGIAVVNTNDQIVVCDSSNHRVQVFDSRGAFVRTFGCYGSSDGEFDCLAGVCVNKYGQYIVTDRYNHRVQIFDSNGRFLRYFGSHGQSNGRFNSPWGVVVDQQGFIYVCDKDNHRIQIFQADGSYVGKFGSIGHRDGQLQNPHFIACSRQNNLYVSDSSNHRIQVFNHNGDYLSSIGAEGFQDGQFKYPRGVAIDDEGFIVVADSGNNRIQVFYPDGKFYCTFGGWGTGDGQLKQVEGICLTLDGKVIVTDRENHRVQVF